VKVVVVTTSYPRDADDVAGGFVRDAVVHLRAAGVEVDVVSPASFPHFDIAYGDGIVGSDPVRPIVVGDQGRVYALGPKSDAAAIACNGLQCRIFVYRTDDPELFWHVLYHEIGHHVYFLVLGSASKKRWATAIYPRSQCPTPYGYSGVAEDFAECYALYAQHTRSLEAFPAKLEFMRDEVFSGRLETLKERSR